VGVLVAIALLAPSAVARTPTQVRFVRDANAEFHYLKDQPPNVRAWMREHYAEMRGYPPYFTRHGLAWAPSPDFYKDMYAIYPNDVDDSRRADTDFDMDREDLRKHPEWVLRSPTGRKLFIKYNCNVARHRCSAYAGDISNPRFRRRWIMQAKESIRRDTGRYAGIFIDNVNYVPSTTDARADEVGAPRALPPRSRRTHRTLGEGRWRRQVARFLNKVENRLPRGLRITHNTYWRQLRELGQEQGDPATLRALAAADRVELERGFNGDATLGGDGPFGYATFASYIDWLHSKNKRLVIQPHTAPGSELFDGRLDNATEATYELVNYLLYRDGQDALVASWRADPPPAGGSWWPFWDLDLGLPSGARYAWGSGGLIRRDFGPARTVVLNPPTPGQTCAQGGAAIGFTLPGIWRSQLSGAVGGTFSLAPCEGQILERVL
jgi:hypothetical protein